MSPSSLQHAKSKNIVLVPQPSNSPLDPLVSAYTWLLKYSIPNHDHIELVRIQEILHTLHSMLLGIWRRHFVDGTSACICQNGADIPQKAN